MFCIVAFVIFAILSIFSASYRPIAKKAWSCVWKRITLTPCDLDLQEEIKSRLLSKLIFSHPKVARFIDRWMNLFALLFVGLSIWSLLVVANGALNYYVYDTCSPGDPEACSLSSGGCGVTSYKPGFWLSVREGAIIPWAKDTAFAYKETFSRIPDRMKTWEPKEFITEESTYKEPFNASKPTALEIIDPSCFYCGQLYRNILEAKFAESYNVTYLLYPIPDNTQSSGYKFPHSLFIARYIEGVKKYQQKDKAPADWNLLGKIFTEDGQDGISEQEHIRTTYTEHEVKLLLDTWLKTEGYSDAVIANIHSFAQSEESLQLIKRQRIIVEKDIRTVKIPTIIFGGRRYDKAASVKQLSK